MLWLLVDNSLQDLSRVTILNYKDVAQSCSVADIVWYWFVVFWT